MNYKILREKCAFPFLVGMALFLRPAAGFSWGPAGHNAIADFAEFGFENSLEPQTRAAITDILGPNIGLADIANCADQLRYGSTPCAGIFDPPLSADKQTGSWHFINIPITAKVSQTPTTDELDGYPDCTQTAHGPTAQLLQDSMRNCIHAQIQFAIAQLSVANPPASAAPADLLLAQRKQRIALMFLVHFVGDAHQPLHTSDDNDFGGNDEKVELSGARKENLHELWDDLIDPRPWQQQQNDSPSILRQKLLADLQSIPQDEVAGWTAGGMETVINNAIGESFNVSQATIYPNYFATRQREFPDSSASQNQKPHGPVVVLDPDYQAKMQPITYRRLLMAGVRLAYILNHTLGQNSANNQKTKSESPVPSHQPIRLGKPNLASGDTWDGDDETRVLAPSGGSSTH